MKELLRIGVDMEATEKRGYTLELVLYETFKHQYKFQKMAIYQDIAQLVQPLMIRWREPPDSELNYALIFRAYFVGVKGGTFPLVRHTLDRFYRCESRNSVYYALIDKLIRLFNFDESHKERYILFLLLHQQYANVAQDLGFLREQLDQSQPLMHEQLLALCRETLLSVGGAKFDEQLQTLVHLLLSLKTQGYHLERTNVIETLAVGFVTTQGDTMPPLHSIFQLFSAIFVHFNIPFNNIFISVLERIPNFMWHILNHTYFDVEPVGVLLPFCTNFFPQLSTLFFTVLYNVSISEISCNPALLTLCEHQKVDYRPTGHVLNPLSLSQMARIKIRRELHRESKTNKEFILKISKLPVPELIQGYLRYMN